MKKTIIIASVFLMLPGLACSAIKGTISDFTSDTSSGSDKTIGEQLDDAKKDLKDCRQNCNDAPTPQLKAQCLKSCEFAESMHEMAVEATKEFSDKTEQEIADEFQKKYYDSMKKGLENSGQ